MTSSNHRIVKNTGLLYFRLIFLTIVNLYAVRVTLDALGVVDYGIFNVIASVVASLSILTGAMTSASQRYLSFHLGRNDYEQYSSVFSLLLMCFFSLSVVLLAIGEILGYFFIDDLLKIPADRLTAAKWLFQASLISFAFGLLTIPYTSSIISNERMDAFAGFSIVEGVLKLGIAFAVLHFNGDRLILYGVLTALINISVFIMSLLYCHHKFPYCRYIWKWNRDVFSELSKYTGWNLFGSISGILATQGQNILLNIFFGPVINAAKAIADRIQSVINGFSINLYTAVGPQIIKSYAAEDYQRSLNLVMKSSKMSFILIFILSFPLICNMDGLLHIWLAADSKTPDMVAFSKLILAYCMILSLEPPISRIIQATGKIRNYQVAVGSITLSFIPVAALVLSLGASAVMTLVIQMIIMSVAQVVRVVVAHRQVGLLYGDYLKTVVVPIFKVIAVGVPVYLLFTPSIFETDVVKVILSTLISGIFGLFIAGILGLDTSDREMIANLINKKIKR